MKEITVGQVKEFLNKSEGLFQNRKPVTKKGFQGYIDHLSDFNLLGELANKGFFVPRKLFIQRIYLKAYGLDSLYSETGSFFQQSAYGACRLFTLLDFYFNDEQQDSNRANITAVEKSVSDFQSLLKKVQCNLPYGDLWTSGVIFKNAFSPYFFGNMIDEYSIQFEGISRKEFINYLSIAPSKTYYASKTYNTWCLYPHSRLIGTEKIWLEQIKLVQEIAKFLADDGFQYKVRLATIWEIMFLAFSFYEATGNQILSPMRFFRASDFTAEPLLFGFIKNKPVISFKSVLEKDYPILLGEASIYTGILPLIILQE